MSSIFDYYQYRKQNHSCVKCGWVGSGENLEIGEVFDTLYEVECPHCHTYLGCVPNPTIEEARKHWSELPDHEKHQLEMLEAMCNEFDRQCLKSADQLPDIQSPDFTLVWDTTDGKVSIRNGSQVVFVEPMIYEGYERYEEVVTILKEKYGEALRGVHPTVHSYEPLCGDKSSAAHRLENFHREVFGTNFEWLPVPPTIWPDLQNLPEDPVIRPLLQTHRVPRYFWPDGVISGEQAEALIKKHGR